jgi:hypothetical protein
MHPGILAQIANPAQGQQNFAQAMNQGAASALQQRAAKQGMRVNEEAMRASQDRRQIANATNLRAQSKHDMAMQQAKAVQGLRAPLMQFESSIGASEKDDQILMDNLVQQVEDPQMRGVLGKIMNIPHGEQRDAAKNQILDLFRDQGLYGGETSLNKEKTRVDIIAKLTGQAPTPTDADDFVRDMTAQWKIDNPGQRIPPGKLAKWRKEYKRAQQQEVYVNQLAKRTADQNTAYQIANLGEAGKQLAQIRYAADLIHARGEDTELEKQHKAKVKLDGAVAHLADLYYKLNGVGGIVNIEKGPISNIWARVKSTDLGQGFLNAMGIEEQSYRNQIKKIKPDIINQIRQATNMGARGLDSEKELEFYLQMVSNEKTDLQSNIAALVALSRAYGLNSDIAKVFEGVISEEAVKDFQKQAFRKLHRGKAEWGQIPYKPIDDKSIPEVTEDFYKQFSQPTGQTVNQPTGQRGSQAVPPGKAAMPLAEAQQALKQYPDTKDIFIELYGAENLPEGF